MNGEILGWVFPVALMAGWFIVAPHSTTRFYGWLYPNRTHPRWYPQGLRVGAVVILILMVLILTGVLR